MKYDSIADLYDSYVRAEYDLPFFIREAGKVDGEILELMSGTGRLSIPLAESGCRLTCVDNSAAMIDILRRELAARDLRVDIFEMDSCELKLNKLFDLILIPFHSFSELLTLDDQINTLKGIYDHLAKTGRFICTLHNPAHRMKTTDGVLRLQGRYSLKEKNRTMLLWELEEYDDKSGIVSGVGFFEEYDSHGLLRTKRKLDVKFRLIDRDDFYQIIRSVGFKVLSIYGDYSYSEFYKESSPSMVWVLGK
jgi:SAM-dependent methyltransferase